MIADLRRLAKPDDRGRSLSCAQIATELNSIYGPGVSRNAVIGKINRLGIEKAPTSESRTPGAVRERRRSSGRPARAKGVRARAPIDLQIYVIPDDHPQDHEIPIDQRRTLFDLTNETCRWPVGHVGEPGFFFCGGPADLASGKPYCAGHSVIARRPPRSPTEAPKPQLATEETR